MYDTYKETQGINTCYEKSYKFEFEIHEYFFRVNNLNDYEYGNEYKRFIVDKVKNEILEIYSVMGCEYCEIWNDVNDIRELDILDWIPSLGSKYIEVVREEKLKDLGL